MGVDLEQLQPGQEFVLQPDGQILPTPMRLAAAAAAAAERRDEQCRGVDYVDNGGETAARREFVGALNPLFGSLLESLAATGPSAEPLSAKAR